MTQLYSVIDIETTGGSAAQDKITEIAVLVTDGNHLIESFTSLINPECRIPPYIVSLTGISNEMVEGAPCFYEIAKKLVELTENTIFVAHNVGFDYGFVKSEFQRLGYRYKRDQLCTVKLSRKLIPGFRSYSLGTLCDNLNIRIENRHRAEGDALATLELFKMLYRIDSENHSGKHFHGFSLKGLHSALELRKLKELPEAAGVYYFYNELNDLIYIGKSNNIYKRVLSHLNNEDTPKGLSMKQEIAAVDCDLTGNELIALLRESHEIKQHKPRYNKAQRRTMHQWGIFDCYDEGGYLNFEIAKTTSRADEPLDSFSSQQVAREVLFSLCNEFHLCQKLCGLYASAGACFYVGIGECRGACTGDESPDDYNKRAAKVLNRYGLVCEHILIVGNGRDENEIGVVSVKNGKYLGYGFCESTLINQPDLLCDCVKTYPDHRDARQIIRTYLNTKNNYRIIRIS